MDDRASEVRVALVRAFERGEHLPGESVSVDEKADALGVEHAVMTRALNALEKDRVVRAVAQGSRVESWIVLRNGSHHHGVTRADGFWLWNGHDSAQVSITTSGIPVKRLVSQNGHPVSSGWWAISWRPSRQDLEAMRLGHAGLIEDVGRAHPLMRSEEPVELIAGSPPTGLRLTWLDIRTSGRSFVSWRDDDASRSLIIGSDGEHIRLWPVHAGGAIGAGVPCLRTRLTQEARDAEADWVATHVFRSIEAVLVDLGAAKLLELDEGRTDPFG